MKRERSGGLFGGKFPTGKFFTQENMSGENSLEGTHPWELCGVGACPDSRTCSSYTLGQPG